MVVKGISMEDFPENWVGRWYNISLLSHPDSRSDPISGSEPVSGRETIYWDSLLVFFITDTYTKELPPEWCPSNIYTYTEFHSHIQNYTYTFANQSVGHTVMNPY